MAFKATVVQQSVIGNKRVFWGTWTNGASDTGGDITTGLNQCDVLFLREKSSAVVGNASVVNTSLPSTNGVVTIVTDAAVNGTWFAIGD